MDFILLKTKNKKLNPIPAPSLPARAAPGCPSRVGAAEDLGAQAPSLQLPHVVVGGRFLPFTLKIVKSAVVLLDGEGVAG